MYAVVAASGNVSQSSQRCLTPGPTSIRYPAGDTRTLSIGHYNAATNNLSTFCTGPTADGRDYPDSVFPSSVCTASAATDTSSRSYGGSSSATPHAVGALALVRNRILHDLGSSFQTPGYGFAAMIADGEHSAQAIDSADGGAGRYSNAGSNSSLHVTSVDIGNLGMATIPINWTPGCVPSAVRVAVWWAEDTDERSFIVAQLRDNNDAIIDTSFRQGVFQRIEQWFPFIGGPTGQWELRLAALAVPSNGYSGSTRRVHVAVSVPHYYCLIFP